MEAAPPSYEKATLTDPWDIIARYIPSNDLCSAALVCSQWHRTFTPHLWGNPASHFGIENDRVYVALTRFKRTLQTARLLVRSQTHTLHLPPAHAEIYNGPHANWLRDIIDRLPNLQSLVVKGIPFFDYAALQALKYNRPSVSSTDGLSPGVVELPASQGTAFQRPVDYVPSFGLRLLDASRCSNVTSSSLAQALQRFEALLYLDLSYTYPARDASVLKTLRRFTGLQVLKLQGIGLNDDLLSVLSTSIGRRVRSLDVRSNYISDRGVRTLLSECFLSVEEDNSSFAGGQRSPALLSYLGHEMLHTYQGEDFESFIRSSFTGRFVGRMAIEDTLEGGITHLYLSDNQVSVEGVSALIRSSRLHVLDVDSVSAKNDNRMRGYSFTGVNPDFDTPGVEKLTPILARFASSGLKYLRIDHALISKDTWSIQSDEIVQGRAELGDTALPDLPRYAAEINSTAVQPETFELPTAQTPRYELPEDPMRSAANGLMNSAIYNDPAVCGPRRGSAIAPEVVVDASYPENDHHTVISPLTASGDNATVTGYFPFSPISPDEQRPTLLPEAADTRPSQRPRTYSSVADERKARLNAHTAAKHNLHPAMLPHLHTLVLTEVPSSSPSKDVSDRLVCFIRQCAEEAQLAKHQARLDYSLPPGRRGHVTALRHAAEKIFTLKHLVLELAPERTQSSRRASQWQAHSARSVTEDRDSETLWSAGETDFSFFDGQEEDYPSLDSGRYSHAFASNEKEVGDANDFTSPGLAGKVVQVAESRFDNIALLSAFRQDRKTAYSRKIIAGAVEPDIEGYWEGNISVIRPYSNR